MFLEESLMTTFFRFISSSPYGCNKGQKRVNLETTHGISPNSGVWLPNIVFLIDAKKKTHHLHPNHPCMVKIYLHLVDFLRFSCRYSKYTVRPMAALGSSSSVHPCLFHLFQDVSISGCFFKKVSCNCSSTMVQSPPASGFLGTKKMRYPKWR